MSGLNGRISKLEKLIPSDEPGTMPGRSLPPLATLMPVIQETAVVMLNDPPTDAPHLDPVISFRDALKTAVCSTGDIWGLFTQGRERGREFSELESVCTWLLLGVLVYRPVQWQEFIKLWPSRLWWQKWALIERPSEHVVNCNGDIWKL